MRELNSVLIEGTVLYPPTFAMKQGRTVQCNFMITHKNKCRKGDLLCHEEDTFQVIICGEDAVLRYQDGLERGRRVRIVGRMVIREINSYRGVFLEAEHVELRPLTKEEPVCLGQAQ